MIKRKYANMRVYDYNIDFEDVENTITYSLSAKNLENNLNKREDELCNKISDLEAKLAEKEEFLHNRDKWIAELERQVNTSRAMERVALKGCKELEEQLEELKQQLAEKERQVKKLNNEAQKYFEDAYCNDSIYQDKISFCIEKFQETKKSLRDKVCLMENDEHYYLQNAIHWQDVVAIIDNKINELKRFLEI